MNQIFIYIQLGPVIPQIVNSQFGLSRGGMMDSQLLDSFSDILMMGFKPQSYIVSVHGKT